MKGGGGGGQGGRGVGFNVEVCGGVGEWCWGSSVCGGQRSCVSWSVWELNMVRGKGAL